MVCTPRNRIRISPVRIEDATELAEMLNEIILRGGTTAYEQTFSADELCSTLLLGPEVVHCVVAHDEHTASLCGFQTLYRSANLPACVADIATFTRIGLVRCGIGSKLFVATRQFAHDHGLLSINATIRADNVSGLKFYKEVGFSDHSVQHGVPLSAGCPIDRISKRFHLSFGKKEQCS